MEFRPLLGDVNYLRNRYNTYVGCAMDMTRTADSVVLAVSQDHSGQGLAADAIRELATNVHTSITISGLAYREVGRALGDYAYGLEQAQIIADRASRTLGILTTELRHLVTVQSQKENAYNEAKRWRTYYQNHPNQPEKLVYWTRETKQRYTSWMTAQDAVARHKKLITAQEEAWREGKQRKDAAARIAMERISQATHMLYKNQQRFTTTGLTAWLGGSPLFIDLDWEKLADFFESQYEAFLEWWEYVLSSVAYEVGIAAYKSWMVYSRTRQSIDMIRWFVITGPYMQIMKRVFTSEEKLRRISREIKRIMVGRLLPFATLPVEVARRAYTGPIATLMLRSGLIGKISTAAGKVIPVGSGALAITDGVSRFVDPRYSGTRGVVDQVMGGVEVLGGLGLVALPFIPNAYVAIGTAVALGIVGVWDLSNIAYDWLEEHPEEVMTASVKTIQVTVTTVRTVRLAWEVFKKNR
ncbi:MAG: hypothetical protein LBG99_06565 [Propionibacteriaceae bacterium]|nr:hypothetical protein [Propionibacteriaceae bacterium]